MALQELDSEQIRTLDEYDPVHRACRVDRHRWSRDVKIEPADIDEYRRIKICEECTSGRVELVNRATLEVVRVWYRYAKGYRAPGMGLQLADFRASQFS